MTSFYQFVDCPTRKNKTIDLLYANVKNAYTASQPTTTRSFRKWQDGDEEGLFSIN
ncbi:uncharacterized protein V6R79_024878 [Siganus canaliculatus]